MKNRGHRTVTPCERYKRDVRHGILDPDPAQAKVVDMTQSLYEALIQPPAAPPGLLGKLLGSRSVAAPKGLYVWGGVGRGKTRLVDSFFDCLPFSEKHRVHYNRFMTEIHSQLKHLPRTPDPLVVVAGRLRDTMRVLVLDEFHVADIADAMLMGGLLRAMFSQGVTLVCTSNSPPDELYKNGLQRERFLPAIQLIKQHTNEVELASESDYRMQKLERMETYHVIRDDGDAERLYRRFNELADGPVRHDTEITVNGRPIPLRAAADNIAWFTYDALCRTERSAHDYMEIARQFDILLVERISVMSQYEDDEAKRFINLIDALYDTRTRLIATAVDFPEKLYTGRQLAFDFQRTISRLMEMSDASYGNPRHTRLAPPSTTTTEPVV
jgi:cell division protein ZapE